MAKTIILFPTAPPNAQDEIPVTAERWITTLSAAVCERQAQGYPQLLTGAAEIRDLAQRIGPIAGEFGVGSAVTLRAIAALLTLADPITLACTVALAGIPGTPAPRRKRGRR